MVREVKGIEKMSMLGAGRGASGPSSEIETQNFWPVSLSRKGKLLALESGGKTTSILMDRYH